jgi:serine/threonine protein kinase
MQVRCPDERELAAYADGSLAEGDAAKLAIHLDDCGSCQQRLTEFETAPGGFAALLRRAGQVRCESGKSPRHGEDAAYPVVFGNYELLAKVAQGGMGAVYKARQRGLNRIVAIKLMLAGQFANEEDRRRFLAEAAAAGQLVHPNIVPVYEIGEEAGQPFYSMGFLRGGPSKPWWPTAPCRRIKQQSSPKRLPKRCTALTPQASCIAISSPRT